MASDMLMSGTSFRMIAMTRVKIGPKLGEEEVGEYNDRRVWSNFLYRYV